MTLLQDIENIYDQHLWAARNVGATHEEFADSEADEQLQARRRNFLLRLIFSKGAWGQRSRAVTGFGETIETDPEDISSHVSERTFDKFYDLLDNDEKVSEIISYVHSQLKVTFAQQLADRLKFLLEVAKEEDPDEVAISPKSLSNFLGFLQSFPNLKYPTVVLSPDKNIRVQWRAGPNKHFAVEFLTSGDARFVIFSPDPNHPEKTLRLSGLTSVDSLVEIAEPHGVLNWSSL